MDEKKVQLTDQELFSFVEFDRRKSEDTGYSDYSYWRSVLRSFAKNKFAVTLLVIMVLLVVFAFFANATARFGIEDCEYRYLRLCHHWYRDWMYLGICSCNRPLLYRSLQHYR